MFITHGYEAWKLHPYFIDYLIVTSERLAEFDLSEAHASKILKVIGIIDFIVAAWLLLRPYWPLLAWLSFWGIITASARPLTLGFASYPEVLLHASYPEVLLHASHILPPIAPGCLIFSPKKKKRRPNFKITGR